MRLEKVPLVVMSLTSVCAQECVEVTNRGNKASGCTYGDKLEKYTPESFSCNDVGNNIQSSETGL